MPKRYLRWVGIALIVLRPVVVLGEPGPPAQRVVAVVNAYYQSRAAGDVATYLDTLSFRNPAARHREQAGAESLWKAVALQQPVLEVAAARLSGSGSEGAVHFTVEYRLVVRSSGESFSKREDNFALLEKGANGWKIRRLIAARDMAEAPRVFDEREQVRWKADAARVREILAGGAPAAGVVPAHPNDVTDVEEAGEADTKENPEFALMLSYDFTRRPDGDAVEDLSGHDRVAKLHGPVWESGNGLYFDGRDDYVEVLGGESLHSDSGLTVVVELIPTSYTNKVWQSVIWKGNSPDCTLNCDNREFSLWLGGTAYVHATSTAKDGVGRGETVLDTAAGRLTGRTVVALVLDSAAERMKLFLDGKQVVSGTYSSAGPRRTEGPLLLGGGSPIDSHSYFRGYLRGLRLYARALTAEELAATARRERPSDPGPWRDPYQLDDVVVPGGWASVIPIHDDEAFGRFDLGKLEPGITIDKGWFSSPTDGRNTEIVFRHDGSALRFTGEATILDCLDECSDAGLAELIITADGRQLWTSGKLRQKGPGRDFDVDLTGVEEIRLVTTDGGNGSGHDWAAWLNLGLEAPSAQPAASSGAEPTGPGSNAPEGQGMKGEAPGPRVEAVYTLDHQPQSTQIVSTTRFAEESEEVFVWFLYRGLTPGDVLTGALTDVGRQLQLRVVPVIAAEEQGAAGFSLRRPVVGWARGHYQVAIKKGDRVLGNADFRIE